MTASRMAVNDILMPCSAVDMGIYFRRRDIFMSQHFLHGKKVCPVLYQMGSERMTEGMGLYLLADTCNQSLLLYHLEDGLS